MAMIDAMTNTSNNGGGNNMATDMASMQMGMMMGQQMVNPVSYTHLDVYKRQDSGYIRRSRGT